MANPFQFHQKVKELWIASPQEDQRIQNARDSSLESALAGAQAAAVAGFATAVPTVIGCRVIPWAKANINHTAQALIISAASIAAFFITADKTTLERARSKAHYDKRT